MDDIFNDKSMIHVHMKTFEKRFDEEFHRWIIKTDVERIDKYKQEFRQILVFKSNLKCNLYR